MMMDVTLPVPEAVRQTLSTELKFSNPLYLFRQPLAPFC